MKAVERPSRDRVRAIRELRSGVQAEVYVGWSSHGRAALRVVANGTRVQKAMEELRTALIEEAGLLLKSAQDDTEARGQKAVGR